MGQPSKKEQEKSADFLTEKSRLIAMLNQCKSPEELSVISEKIANLAEATSKKSKSVTSSEESDHAYDNEDDCYGFDIDDLLDQELNTK